jgi:hypothetical protein
MTRSNILQPDGQKLNPKFESYRLHTIDQDKITWLNLPCSASKVGNLPSNAKASYQELRVRVGWNCLSYGVDNGIVYYIGQGGLLVGIRSNEANVLCQLWEEDEVNCPLYAYYPSVHGLSNGLLLVTDGRGRLRIVKEDGSPINVEAFVKNGNEHTPVIVHDARLEFENSTQCTVLYTSPHSADPKQYVLSIANLNLSTSELTICQTKTLSEIPRLARVLSRENSLFVVTSTSIEKEVAIGNEAAKFAKYTWFQTSEDVTISIALPLTVLKSHIEVLFAQRTIEVMISALPRPLYPFKLSEKLRLWAEVDPEHCTWTLSSITSVSDESGSAKVLDLHLEKAGDRGLSRWPTLFELDDRVVESIDPSDRRTMIEALEKYTANNEGLDQNVDKMEDADAEIMDHLTVQWIKNENVQAQVEGVVLVGRALSPLPQIVVKYDVDALLYEVSDLETTMHKLTYPAISYIASSKRSQKFTIFTPLACIIAESSISGNVYIYWRTDENYGRQSIIRTGLDISGVSAIDNNTILIMGDNNKAPQGILIDLRV